MTPEDRLADLGLELPDVPAPVANFTTTMRVGSLLFLAGHGPVADDKPVFVGKLGRDLAVGEGREAAQLVALNMLATIKRELSELSHVRRVIKLLCMINATPDFEEHPSVADGASDLFVALFGHAGRGTRSAVGHGSLPFGIAVEIEGVFELDRD